ncbi:Putative arabinose 5-phosphate isomerase [Tolypocladium paradoxum]|uniref:Arabinose 5-phosphate isomerase n=1 Tax=Tolypocladium paradoxum TaxID=94208 RepID=A0A2S4L879_9HYPO|nr:Putative arabinose 5-phosphate isomerase [Tolypocladium paradoxum]
MADRRQGEHRPIQTSAVIVLGAQKGPAVPPPSPPTPCVSPYDSSLCELTDQFSLRDRPPSPQLQATEQRLSRGLHVLNTEAAALANLARLYETDPVARDGFDRAVQVVTRQSAAHGKLVVVGVGKSGHIGKKLVATLQSLAIRSVFLHPTEALHGDLGIVGPNDTLLFITYSGKTQELLLLLPHLDETLPTIILTSHVRPGTCELARRRQNAILLPAPIPEAETMSFGVPAPSTSTTVALALGDALAITVANELHQNVPAEFARNHPGGAIGAATRPPQTVKHIAVPWEDIPGTEEGLTCESLGVDLLRAGYDSRTGWVKVEEGVAAPGRIRQLSRADLCLPLREMADVVVARHDMMVMSSDTSLRQAGDLVRMRTMQAQDDGEGACGPDAVIAVTEGGSIVGVLEAGQVIHDQAV